MKKLRDYLIKIQKDMYSEADLKDLITTTSNVGSGFFDAMADGIKTLEITKEEYRCLINYFSGKLPWNWSGKSIWRIKLVVKEPTISPSIPFRQTLLEEKNKFFDRHPDIKAELIRDKNCKHKYKYVKISNNISQIICKKCGKIEFKDDNKRD